MRHAMLVDLDLCIGCKACVSACKEQWDSGPGAARDWVHTHESGTREANDLAVTFYPGLCMQCEAHPCTVDCPTGATRVDSNGVVVVDADVCIGCGNCVSSCPYGARHVDPVKKIVEKCNLCAPFVARGDQPACVKTCPAECRIFGDVDDPTSPVSIAAAARGARPLAVPGIDVKPRTLYAGDAKRARLLGAGFVKVPGKSWLTRTWGVTMPLARSGVPLVGAVSVAGGLLVNLKARMDRVKAEEGRPTPTAPPTAPATSTAAAVPPLPDELHRHPVGPAVPPLVQRRLLGAAGPHRRRAHVRRELRLLRPRLRRAARRHGRREGGPAPASRRMGPGVGARDRAAVPAVQGEPRPRLARHPGHPGRSRCGWR